MAPKRTRAVAEGDEFLESLMDTSLYSMGAYFTDQHPDLVDEVITQATAIEEAGLRGYAEAHGMSLETCFETLLTGLADIRATSFKDSKAGTGLDAPTLTVYMKYDQDRSEERATFGKNGNNAFASRPDDAGAMAIEAEKLTEAITTLDELVQ